MIKGYIKCLLDQYTYAMESASPNKRNTYKRILNDLRNLLKIIDEEKADIEVSVQSPLNEEKLVIKPFDI